MNKKYFAIILTLLVIVSISGYLFIFQKETLRQCRDFLVNTTTYFKVANSTKYKEFAKSDKSKKYYKNEKEIKIPILLYHQICNTNPNRTEYHLSTTTNQFRTQITGLKNLGYTFITYDDLIAYNNNELALPEYCVIITFDDGYKNVYENAFPIAKELNIPITMFVIDSCFGIPEYISWDDAREMDKSGIVSIYTHSKNHIDYSKANKDDLLDNITSAHSTIEKQLGHPVSKVMAYPYGGYNDNEIEVLKYNGFIQNILLDVPNLSSTLDMSKLNRIFVKQNYSVYKILEIIL